MSHRNDDIWRKLSVEARKTRKTGASGSGGGRKMSKKGLIMSGVGVLAAAAILSFVVWLMCGSGPGCA